MCATVDRNVKSRKGIGIMTGHLDLDALRHVLDQALALTDGELLELARLDAAKRRRNDQSEWTFTELAMRDILCEAASAGWHGAKVRDAILEGDSEGWAAHHARLAGRAALRAYDRIETLLDDL